MNQNLNIWFSGQNNFKVHELDHKNKKFISRYIKQPDVSLSTVRQPADIYREILTQKSAEGDLSLMYSGGVDSECVAITCVKHKIPLTVWTKRFLFRGIEVNVQDLYYSSKFCQRHGINQVILDCDIENVDWLNYCRYHATHWIAASHFWLLERVDGIPIFGGDVPYPRHDKNGELEFEPRYIRHSTYDVLLADQGRTGITNMASHTYELLIAWLKIYSNFFRLHGERFCGERGITYYTPWANAENKQAVNNAGGFGLLEKRFKSIGCELLDEIDFPFREIHAEMEKRVPNYTPITEPSLDMLEVLELYK